MLTINDHLSIAEHELQWYAVRAQGAGGQNVNKVSSAIHLRFDVRASGLPADVKDKLLALTDHRMTKDGVIVIKAQEHRRQQQNKDAARRRLARMIREALIEQAPRIATMPSRASVRRRLDSKSQRGQLKAHRRRVPPE